MPETNSSHQYETRKSARSCVRKAYPASKCRVWYCRNLLITARSCLGFTQRTYRVHSRIRQGFSRSNAKGKIRSANLREKERLNARTAVSIIYRKMTMRNACLQLLTR